jgi:serine phosphatase RsbU (regulator of sigma subunit)
LKLLQKLGKNLVYFLAIAIIGVFVFILIDLDKTVDVMSKNMVDRSITRSTLELDNFFDPIKENLMVKAIEHSHESFNCDNVDHLNYDFRPLIEESRQISSALLANKNGDECLVLDLDSSWMFRVTRNGSADSLPEQFFWNKKNLSKISKSNRKNESYDPRTRPWFQNAVLNISDFNINWTDPYIFFTTKDPGITISTKWKDQETQKDVILAFDVLLNDISKFTTKTEVSPNGFVFILSENKKMLGLPALDKFQNEDEIIKNVLSSYDEIGVPEISETVNFWEASGEKDTVFSFESQGDDWWGAIKKYQISNDSYVLVGVSVPEKDFVGSVKRSELFILVGFVIVLFFVGFIIKAYRDKQKSNQILFEQKRVIEENKEEILFAKHEIEEKSDEILDSINYAKRIQTAILPSNSVWNENLKNSFVLYLPKDIVAGDFYWMEKIGEKVYFAAADCTGHGVPGAMVSVVCHSALNRAVREFNLRKPSDILDKVTDLVIRTFEKSDHEVKDGMDISLCAVDLNNMKIEYAGAHNPFWLVRKGLCEFKDLIKSETINDITLYEVKADKQPIGKFAFRKAFTNHEINLEKGDAIYLSSDGFPDQFGGPKGKKLKTKSLKKLLIRINEEPILEQKTLLTDEFNSWKGKLEQLDDVCLIGLKI